MQVSNNDVVFVNFPCDYSAPESKWCLGYRYMISALRKNGFSATIIHPEPEDDHVSKRHFIDAILKADASIVGFETYDEHLPALLAFIKELRGAGLESHVTLGGMCASAIPMNILQNVKEVDSVVCSEGELTMVDLAKHVVRKDMRVPIPGMCWREGNALVKGENRSLIEDLDTIPAPDLDDFQKECQNFSSSARVPVMASRGCYGNCSFCSIQRFYRNCPGKVWRARSAASLVDEITELIRLTGIDKITFIDENFMGPGKVGRRHAIEIAHEIKCRQLRIFFNFGCRANDINREVIEILKGAGLTAITLGIESMSADSLQLFNKSTTPALNYHTVQMLEELMINVEITFIFFHPLTTLKEIRENLSLSILFRNSQYLYFNNNQPFTEFIPFFGTGLTKSFEEMGLVKKDLTGHAMHYLDPHVDFITRSIFSVPVQRLSRLRSALPVKKSRPLVEIKASLREYEIHLKMVRLPELVYDLCDLFDQGAAMSDSKVSKVVAQFHQETERINLLIRRFIAHLP